MSSRPTGFERVIMAFAGFAGILDTSFLIPVIALYAYSLGASEAQAGFIAGLYSMVAIPASVVAGVLIDKFGRKRMLVLGLLWDSASMLLYALVITPAQLAFVRALHALGGSLVFPAFIARSREVSGERAGLGLGLMLAPVALAIAIGSGSAGVATAVLGYRVSFTLIALILAVAGFLALTLPPRPEERAWRGLRGVASGLGEVMPSVLAGLWVILVLYISIGLIVGGLATSLVKAGVLEEREARLVTGISVSLSSLIAVAFFIVSGLAADRFGVPLVLLYSSISGFIGFAIAATNPATAGVMIGLAVFGVGLAGLMLVSTILVSNAPPRARGTSIGLQQVLNIVGVAIGAPIGGVLAGAGPRPLLLLAAVVTLLALAVIPLTRHSKSSK
ncbi:MAG: MFS transporter [Desulfurococcaceae archaeon]|nr:MFS transporter [Desulfurococcaceae archaeon]